MVAHAFFAARSRSAQRVRHCLALAGWLAMLSGCTPPPTESGPPLNAACAVELALPAGDENCVGAFDVEYRYVNPPRPPGSEAPQTAALAWADSDYVAQESATDCYAATLSMAFRYLHPNAAPDAYAQAGFSRAIGNECFGTGRMPLTFSQIVFAATKVRVSTGGTWYVDLADHRFSAFFNDASDRSPAANQSAASWSVNNVPVLHKNWVCQDPHGDDLGYATTEFHIDPAMLLHLVVHSRYFTASMTTPQSAASSDLAVLESQRLYHKVTWPNTGDGTRPAGFIAPIRNTGDLVDRLKAGLPVLAGLKSGQFGHVVLVRAVRFYPSVDAMRALQLAQQRLEEEERLLQNLQANPGSASAVRDLAAAEAHEPELPLGAETRIASVEVVDPAKPDKKNYDIPGDDFIASVSFMFALEDTP